MVSFFFAYPILRSVSRVLPEELPRLGRVPPFKLTDEMNREVTPQSLKGKVYLVHFMTLHCSGICDISFKEMQQVQHRLRGVMDRAAIVSISLDPQNDTTQNLELRARELKAKPDVWFFTATDTAQTEKLALATFNLPGVDGKKIATYSDLLASNHVALVDQAGNIRGYYPLVKNGVNRLMIDIGLLINAKTKS